MAIKLLTKSTRNLLLFSVLTLLVSAPAVYFITDALYIGETDETLHLHKQEFLENHANFSGSDIEQWNKYNRNVKILPFNGLKSDTIFTRFYFDALENENEPYRELIGPIKIANRTYTYQERNNLIEQADMVLGVALLFFAVIVILLVGILIINKISSTRLWKPFYNTLDKMESFELDKIRRPEFSQTGIQEFDRLNRSVDNLIEKNQMIYQNQREFVENAAHELQTPLALFQGKIDTLFQTHGLSGEQSIILDSLNTDVGRLNRLNKNLLLLSKIDNESFFEKQGISIQSKLSRNLDFFTEQANSKNLTLITDLENDIQIMANQTLAEVLINNLFLNAIRHNVQDGIIKITISGQVMEIINSGPMQSLHSEKLFNRFSKDSSSTKGNGLGLAIVKKIAEINNWNISYDFNENLHRFKVNFKTK